MGSITLTLLIVSAILVGIACISAFLWVPGRRSAMDDELINTSYAHRGLHGDGIPENSMAAFRKALAEGYGIEIDVQATLDDKIVVFHDNNLLRMTGFNGEIEDTTLKEIQELHLANSEEGVPTLEEFLRLVDGRVPLLIEIKDQKKYKRCVSLIMEQLASYSGKYSIQSFNPFILRVLRKKYPSVARGLLSNDYVHGGKNADLNKISRLAMTYLLVNAICRPNFISYNVRSDINFAMKLMKKVFKVPFFAWTVDTEKTESKANRFYDVLIFERFQRKQT
ncbi:MAG: glycerophosphodiester phosphodiesterase family protein [Peptostreptococcaceae bacterium]|nr:glycerophosphodiester phosphodiesterase family protein [Peptostreptococcaceae bacterium]MDY5738452.1 glycerophosphodiester phosphodiesterase family protein [Anaerovoracaceae bacterium]